MGRPGLGGAERDGLEYLQDSTERLNGGGFKYHPLQHSDKLKTCRHVGKDTAHQDWL